MYHENATTIERIFAYVEHEEYEKAEALAKIADYWEQNFQWEVSFTQQPLLE